MKSSVILSAESQATYKDWFPDSTKLNLVTSTQNTETPVHHELMEPLVNIPNVLFRHHTIPLCKYRKRITRVEKPNRLSACQN